MGSARQVRADEFASFVALHGDALLRRTRWEALSVTLILPAEVTEGPVAASVVFTTRGGTPVALYGPCPNYVIIETTPLANGDSQVSGGGAGSFCSQHLVVMARHPLAVPISSVDSNLDRPWLVGGVFTLSWSIAGVPAATERATIR